MRQQIQPSGDDEHVALSKVVGALKDLDDYARQRILQAVATFYDVHPSMGTAERATARGNRSESRADDPLNLPSREPSFSGHEDLSPKQFLEQKQPRSDTDRVACLAYYLAHFRDTPHFKTIDISKLNTEAAQFKFSNAALAVNNANWRGLLVSAGKGMKQISALGERFVAALPDRDASKKVLEQMRVRRRRKSLRSRRAGATEG